MYAGINLIRSLYREYTLNRGYYTAVRGYEFYLRVLLFFFVIRMAHDFTLPGPSLVETLIFTFDFHFFTRISIETGHASDLKSRFCL